MHISSASSSIVLVKSCEFDAFYFGGLDLLIVSQLVVSASCDRRLAMHPMTDR